MCLWVLRRPNIVKIVLDTIYIFILSYWGRNFWYHTLHTHESRKAKVPYISVDDKPAAKGLKSVYNNITRERAWRPLYEKELQNSNPPWSWSWIEAGVRPKQSYSWVSLYSIARLLVTRVVLICVPEFLPKRLQTVHMALPQYSLAVWAYVFFYNKPMLTINLREAVELW